MITVTFRHKDKDIDCVIPESWDELTVKQSIALNLKTFTGNPLQAIAALSGLEEKELFDIKLSKSSYKAIGGLTAFLNSPPPDMLLIKKQRQIDINGVSIDVPEDLQKESFGQYILFQQFADHPRALPMIMAIYLQPMVDGKIGDLERIEELSFEIEKMTFVKVFPIVNFFFRKLRKYLRSGIKEYYPYQYPMSKE